MKSSSNDMFSSTVLGHPQGLFILFFTEMWERFSFYGMRVLLINFLTMAVVGTNPGWEWSAANAGALFGTYAGLLYLTPILGGMIADRFTGYRMAVVIGCIIMTLGHACMALETEFSLYAGLGLLVIGTGFFKPNITSIISTMYKDLPEKKDGAYTIFYMGVNAGAFLGMMLCGYLAEKVGWSWGFGLAGIFMLLGCLQFWLSGSIFGEIGAKPVKASVPQPTVNDSAAIASGTNQAEEKRNPFTMVDKILIAITSVIGFLYLINDPVSKIGGVHLLPEAFIFSKEVISGDMVIIIIGLILFLFLAFSRIFRYEKVVRNKMLAVITFAFFTVFFFASFEQGATSLVLFARDYTNRSFFGAEATIFNVVNLLLTVVPLLIITWVLFLLFKKTYKKIFWANVVLGISFVAIWGIVGWMLNNDFSSKAYEVKYQIVESPKLDDNGNPVLDEKGRKVFEQKTVTESTIIQDGDKVSDEVATISNRKLLNSDDKIFLHTESVGIVYLNKAQTERLRTDYKQKARDSQIIPATVVAEKGSKVDVTTSWFSILNSFFIIAFASFFSKWWDSKYNPSAAMKYALGLIIMGIGFGILAYGSMAITPGSTVKVSMIWLILAYLFHTLGELCISPVGLSYVSKLVPPRMIAFMFGMWYLAIAIGNKLASSLGGMSETISEEYSMSTFFLIFTIIPITAGLIVAGLNPVIKKLMSGVK